jgi:transposase-like protein
MVVSHLDEYDSVYKAARAIGPKVGVQAESLRRWVQEELARSTPEGERAEQEKAAAAKVKELERKVRDLEEANEILKAASIFFAGEPGPRRGRK